MRCSPPVFFSIGLTIWYGGLATLEGNLKLGVLVTYFGLSMSLFQPVREIADKWNTFLSGMASAERIFSVLEWEPELESLSIAEPATPLVGVRGHIVFENVWFSYSTNDTADLQGNWVLENFSLTISAGERLGVVGECGNHEMLMNENGLYAHLYRYQIADASACRV